MLKTLAQIGSPEFIRKLSSSRFNYWAGYVANLSLVAWLCSRAWSFEAGTPVARLALASWLSYAVTGLVIWTLAEYLLHRYTYHEVKSPLRTGHLLHHEEPRALLGVPWYLTTIVLVAVYYGFAAIFDPAATGVVMGFTWLGYIGYCFVHHSIHHFQFTNPYFKAVHKHHLIHHVHPELNHGITCTLWDYVFGTKRRN